VVRLRVLLLRALLLPGGPPTGSDLAIREPRADRTPAAMTHSEAAGDEPAAFFCVEPSEG